ncbi:Tannase/feruloyl esterase [Podospora aff. communis PSN243]|uniref:Carboxylic ester hydrolase n=1 Tax=Podospora aff. communis PSN243 TaxID=3040156 RepID=A0AAV9G6V2_9PEZI|nr:Tannase/feruloyl esterase [Podospora aff. communis PSN243]
MRSLAAGALVALLGLAQAAPSPDTLKVRQVPEGLKNCNEAFFSSVISAKKLGGKIAPNSPYTPDTEPYEGDERALFFANHETDLNIDDICGVRIHVTDNVAFELYLPSPKKWNKRFLTVGNGGFSGRTNRLDMFSRAVQNWATMSTNTGNEEKSDTLAWAANKPDLQKDWAHRAMAQSVPYAKALVAAYYKDIPTLGNYYSGCSTGGRQGIRQIEVDPKSFDGMLIGAPAWNVRSAMPVASRIGWLAETTGLKVTGLDDLLTARMAIHIFTLCNGLDGSIADGVVRDSATCRALLRGSSRNETIWAASNTTIAQREAFLTLVEEFKTPPRNETYAGDGFDPTAIHDMAFGSYLLDGRLTGNFTHQFAKYWLNLPIIWDSDEHGAQLLKAADEWDKVIRANADPRALSGKGSYKGKTILYTGTADGFVSSLGTRRAFELAGGANNKNLAYFEIPGMSHCVDLETASVNPPWYIGGVGLHIKPPGNITYIPESTGLVDAKHDALIALAEWHEGGWKRPDTIVASAFANWGSSQTNFTITKKRPVCRAPMKQVFKGPETAADDENAWSCA